MKRETEFQKTIKYFIYGAAGICALCQIILLFVEFTFFNGVGMIFNGLFHLSGVAAPVLIFILFFKMNDEKEVYSNYVLALNVFLGVIVDLVILIKYIINMNATKGFNVGIIIGFVLLIIVEVFYGLILIWYGLDKVTSVLPLLIAVVVCIFKGSMLNVVDSAFNIFAYNTVKGSVFSVWTFMYLMFYLALIICMILYLDSDSLLDIIRNPKELFTKNTFVGTYTNLYLKEDKNKEMNTFTNNEMMMPNQNQMVYQANQIQNPAQSVQPIGVCPDCGNVMYSNQNMCSTCGCPIELVVRNNSNSYGVPQTMMYNSQVNNYATQNGVNTNPISNTVVPDMNSIDQMQNNMVQNTNNSNQITYNTSNNVDVDNNKIMQTSAEKLICPDCGGEVFANQSACPVCGSPNTGFIKNTAKEQILDLGQDTIESDTKPKKICPDCGNEVDEGVTMCNKCGCPM